MYSEYKRYLEKQRFNMEYNFLSPNCGLKVSAICLGTMTMKKEGKTVSGCVLVSLLSKGEQVCRRGRVYTLLFAFKEIIFAYPESAALST